MAAAVPGAAAAAGAEVVLTRRQEILRDHPWVASFSRSQAFDESINSLEELCCDSRCQLIAIFFGAVVSMLKHDKEPC